MAPLSYIIAKDQSGHNILAEFKSMLLPVKGASQAESRKESIYREGEN